MGSAVHMLASDPRLQDELRAHPERIGVFVEEALRLESPFRGHFRVTREDTVLGGVALPKGARLMLMWGAGNRDPQTYSCPADLDLAREKPKQHLAFGSGIHFCLGAPLARLEGGGCPGSGACDDHEERDQVAHQRATQNVELFKRVMADIDALVAY